MSITPYLQKLTEAKGSDLYFSTGAPPMMKVEGAFRSLEEPNLKKGDIKELAYSIMDPAQCAQFEQKPEMNLALSESGVGRFRVNIFKQRSDVAMVIRSIQTHIPSLEDLHLPPILAELVMEKRGLILFVGASGSGKSTSLATLINHRNTNSAGHIITIEDPVEFIHPHKRSIVNQREVGVDTDSYSDALKNTLRQAPDVILIGEIRTQETMQHTMVFAETGHLCLSTLHANNANQALDRIINFFPDEHRQQLLLDLPFNLKAIVSQRLIPCLDGTRRAAIEIMLGTPLILDLIQRNELESLKEIMEKSTQLGMQTFDQDLERLYHEGVISFEEAIKNADSKNNLRVSITLKEKSKSAPANLTLQDDEMIELSRTKK